MFFFGLLRGVVCELWCFFINHCSKVEDVGSFVLMRQLLKEMLRNVLVVFQASNYLNFYLVTEHPGLKQCSQSK